MKVYLVRRGSNQVVHVTFSLEQAKERVIKLTEERMVRLKQHEQQHEQRRGGVYEVSEQSGAAAFDAKILKRTIIYRLPGGSYHWVDSFWVQAHQLMDSPLGLLASSGDEET